MGSIRERTVKLNFHNNQMNPAENCVVKPDTPIWSQEKDSLIIFQLSEGNGHKEIVGIVVRCPLKILIISFKKACEYTSNKS
jgi:hypothetical protein